MLIFVDINYISQMLEM